MVLDSVGLKGRGVVKRCVVYRAKRISVPSQMSKLDALDAHSYGEAVFIWAP